MLHTPIWRAKRVVAQHLPPCLRGPALHADSRRPPGQARVANRQCSQGSSRTEAPRHLRGISMHRNWQAKQFPTAAVSVTSRASGAHWPPGWLVLRSSRQRQLHVHRWTAASMRAVSAMAWGKSCFPESIAKGSSVQSPSEKYKGSSTQRIRLVRTPAPGVDPDDRRRLDFVAYGATQLGEALCCDVTLVSPLARDGRPQPSSTTRDGAALAVAERRKRAAYPELLRRGPQRLCVLACETGGRWNDESLRLVAQLVRSRALRALAPLRGAATQGWYRRWWGLLSVAVQNTLVRARVRDRRTLERRELPPRAGTGGGGACSVHRICRTSYTTRARLCLAACRPTEWRPHSADFNAENAEVTTVWHKMGQTSYVTEVELRCFRFCFPHSFPVTTSLDNKHGRLRLQSKGHRQRKSAQFARLPGDLAITGEREFQQKRRDGELCSDSSPDQRANYPSSMAGWCVRGALPGEHPEPVGRLRTNRPPTSTPTTKRQSRLSLGQFNSTGLGSTCPRDGADDDGINSLLRAMPQGQSVCFNAADIRGRRTCRPVVA
ncbi:hypothetical protein AK812_SmicGene17239 [Symbiodinium microadriaticum]|uniref:Uncharacterized protein n=1 Tax=Symbiodinium microadriaticum TaxID=2951 RepID=A0A1Q9DYA0_SYMMI|nr:hypothetical protein AK812_SmicGene17239 [Symbiodinium microadriaticum]